MHSLARHIPALGACLVASLLAIAGCGGGNVYQPPPPPEVTVARPLQKTVTRYLEETGTTEAVDKVEVRARVKGILVKQEFEPDSLVKKGEVLYRIDPQEYQAKVDRAEATLEASKVEKERAQTEYERQLALQKEDATAERKVVEAKAQRDAAKAAIDLAKAELELAKIDLDYTKVQAEIGGRVAKTFVTEGNLVGDKEATLLTKIISYDPIYANFNISENTLLELMEEAEEEAAAKQEQEQEKDKATDKLKKGKGVVRKLVSAEEQGAEEKEEDVNDGKKDEDAIKEKKKETRKYKTRDVELRRTNDEEFRFKGKLDYADLAVDQSTGNFLIRGVFPNPDEELLPGLFVRIRVPIGEIEDALLVPRAAVGFDQEGRYVYVVSGDNEVERRNVELGPERGNLQVILPGGELKADDWVIVRGVQRAREKAKVKPIQTKIEDRAKKKEKETKPPTDKAQPKTAAAPS